MDAAQQILAQWQDKREAKRRTKQTAAITAGFDQLSTEQLAVLALATIIKTNGIKTDSPLFRQPVSPTAHAMVEAELHGLPEEAGQSNEVSKCYEETYRQEWRFAIGDGYEDHGAQTDPAEIVFGEDPAELSNEQWLARETLAENIKRRGGREANYRAERLLAMQGDRLEFSR